MPKCKVPRCQNETWPTFDGVCWQHGMFPETTVWPVCRKRVPAKVLLGLAWECWEVDRGMRAREALEMPAGSASHALHAQLSDGNPDGKTWPSIKDFASLFMGLADLGDWKP